MPASSLSIWLELVLFSLGVGVVDSDELLVVLRRDFILKDTLSFDTRKLSSCKSWLGLSKLSIIA